MLQNESIKYSTTFANLLFDTVLFLHNGRSESQHLFHLPAGNTYDSVCVGEYHIAWADRNRSHADRNIYASVLILGCTTRLEVSAKYRVSQSTNLERIADGTVDDGSRQSLRLGGDRHQLAPERDLALARTADDKYVIRLREMKSVVEGQVVPGSTFDRKCTSANTKVGIN